MSPEMPVQPNPNVVISDADQDTLPLNYFHLVVIVEPDPETYIPLPTDQPKLDFVIQGLSASIWDENDPDQINMYNLQITKDMPETGYVWVRYYGIDYFEPLTENLVVKAIFNLVDYKDLDHFTYYLKGVFPNAKDWRVAVIGAMFEDDVIRIANLIDELGFSVTILQRYCISNNTFINLDNLSEYESWIRSYQSPEEQRTWLDEWLGDDHSDDEND